MKTMFENIIELIKTNLPAADSLIEYQFTERPMVLLRDKDGKFLGNYQDVTIKLRVGCLPADIKPKDEL